MEFALSPRLAELKQRAASLTGKIMQFEGECEANNGLPPEAHAVIRDEVLAHGLPAINMPAE